MKKINYKGRCERRKVSKCKDICRTYTKIQSAFVDLLEKEDDVVSFECNVPLKGVVDDMYSTDFVGWISGSLRLKLCSHCLKKNRTR